MRACIHRGAAVLGGSCVEVEHQGRRLILDVGLPLNTKDSHTERPLVPGLIESDPDIEAVVLSHNHPDHAGLAEQVPSQVALWGPAVAQRMQQAGSQLTGSTTEVPERAWQPLRDGIAEQHGPFRVTPFAVDHSAYESYALLVEAGGRRLFYTGDLRAHGRKPGMWGRLLDRPPRDVNALLMEGTTLSRTGPPGPTEGDVEQDLVGLCKHTPGMVLACYSGHNIDRLVSVYRAAKRSGRTLVLDLYGAAIAAATERSTIPQPGWDGVRVFLPHAQRRAVIKHGLFKQVDALAAHRVYPEELRARASSLVMTTRGSMTRDLHRADCVQGAAAAWSMWPGYLDTDGTRRLTGWMDHHDIPLTVAHASGHANPEELRRLARAIDPDRLVPIHTAAPERYRQLHDRVAAHPDGEWWSV